MTIRFLSYPLFMLSCFTLCTTYGHTQKEEQKYPGLEDTLRNLCQPVKTTSSGFTAFLEEVYNNDLYVQEILPNNFSHLIQFLGHGKKTKQTKAYIQSVIRLFSNRLKASSYVNAHAFDTFLHEVPSLLDCYFLGQRTTSIHLLQEKINTLLYEQFKNNFSAFQNNPGTFFNDLTQEILEALSLENQDLGEVSTEELRKSILIFLEVSLNKLIWSPEDQLETWFSVKTISEHLTRLMDCNIIADPDDLNSLYITLVERYCFFLEVAGTHLSAEFYQKIQQEISSTSLPLLDMEEQEPFIQSKRERLQEVLAKIAPTTQG